MEYVSINCVTSPPRTTAVSLTKEAKSYRTTALKSTITSLHQTPLSSHRDPAIAL
ncbi:hypothetical protein TIFTF001_014074 [Ficus carica]|uniref:Uncharacterized protein n=1 Tax=Ficus carica TaxID=3494 RepID=A0AA88D3P1_FICCA|nr:hypothetical protein TIFTF001_014074 [Ficus carica]